MSEGIEQLLQDIMEDRWPGSAKAILHKVLKKWFEGGKPYPLLGALSKPEDGEWLVTYDSKQYDFDDAYGEFVCKFIPLSAVEKIIEECGRIYDECAADYKFNVLSDPEWQRSARDEAIEGMAEIATRRMLIGLMTRLCEAVEDTLDESLLLAEVAIRGHLKMFLEGEYIENREPVDCRQMIAKAKDKVANREQVRLEGLLSHNVPRVRVNGPGRPTGQTKTIEEKERQRLAFERQIEDAFRKLLADTGQEPNKTKVAQELSIGGRSPHTGNDTSLNAFNGKLFRLGVDYEQIVRKVRRAERES